MKLKDVALNERPRERLHNNGPSALSNTELLALILRQGTHDQNVLIVSQKILKEYSLKELSNKTVPELKQLRGIGDVKASQIVACFEIAKRITDSSQESKPVVSCAKDVYSLLGPKLMSYKKEHVVTLYLNSRKQVIKQETISIGTLDSAIIHPREILSPALNEGASAFIIVHNHPSGNPLPSEEDSAITEQLLYAGEVLGIPLIDHVIIGDGSYFSFQDEGLIS